MIKITTVRGNIEAQEGLMTLMRSYLELAGPEKVAERLGITVENLNERMAHFTDLTLTELRLLSHAMDVIMTFQAVPNSGFPIVDEKPEYEIVDTRDPACVEAWPECESFKFDSRCCRFPKNCSAGSRWTRLVEKNEETISPNDSAEG